MLGWVTKENALASPITKAEELVALARHLREVGCLRCKWGDIELEMLNPEKPGLGSLKDQVADLPIDQREEILADVKRQLDQDLYGAAG